MENSRNGDVTVTFEQALFGGHRRNGRFPTYLDLVREDGEPLPPPPPPQRRPLPPASRRRTYADGELDVFAAERYFKGAIDGDYTPAAVVPADISAAGRPAVAVSRPAWTTRASVASAASGSGSTADSQTVLLRRDHRRRGAGGKCCVQVGGILRSCSGKRSVHVDGGGGGGAAITTMQPTAAGEPTPLPASRIEWYRDLRMDKAGHRVAVVGLAAGDVTHGVVASGGLPLPPNSNNLGAAKVETTSGSFRRNFALLAPVKVNGAGAGDDVDDDNDDVGSESSSDLFEIKSLMIDDCPYEPSEASVQWSVVTASAAAVSVASSKRAPAIAAGNGGGKGRPAMSVRQQQRPVGLLTGCVSHRAIDVSAMASVRRPPPPARAPAMSATTRRRTDVSRFANSGNL